MYKSTFRHSTGKKTPLPYVPDELQGICKVCGKKFLAYKETNYNTQYCNLHWDKTKKVKRPKTKKNITVSKKETWKSLITEELNTELIPYKWKKQLIKELGRNQHEDY